MKEEKVSFQELSKEEGSKTKAHKPEKEHEKEKEQDLGRKSMGAGFKK